MKLFTKFVFIIPALLITGYAKEAYSRYKPLNTHFMTDSCLAKLKEDVLDPLIRANSEDIDTLNSTDNEEVHSEPEDVSIDILLTDLEEDIKETNTNLNCLFDVLGEGKINSDYEKHQDQHAAELTEAFTIAENMRNLTDEFYNNTLEFFNEQSGVYFTLFGTRLAIVKIQLKTLIKSTPEADICRAGKLNEKLQTDESEEKNMPCSNNYTYPYFSQRKMDKRDCYFLTLQLTKQR